MKRCSWAEKSDIEKQYHDNEWGVCLYDDDKWFELLNLECMQAGLNWQTILKRRNFYKSAFDNWDIAKISKYENDKIISLMNNDKIIRNLSKIKAIIANANAYIKIQEEFQSFNNYIWHFVENKPIVNVYESLSEVPAYNSLSEKISKDLKKRGFKYTGKTIIYAFLQASGVINDHVKDCEFKYR